MGHLVGAVSKLSTSEGATSRFLRPPSAGVRALTVELARPVQPRYVVRPARWAAATAAGKPSPAAAPVAAMAPLMRAPAPFG